MIKNCNTHQSHAHFIYLDKNFPPNALKGITQTIDKNIPKEVTSYFKLHLIPEIP
jgi:hypothetical protein